MATNHQKPGPQRAPESPSQPTEATNPAHTLISNFSLWNCEMTNCFAHGKPVWGTLSQQLQGTNRATILTTFKCTTLLPLVSSQHSTAITTISLQNPKRYLTPPISPHTPTPPHSQTMATTNLFSVSTDLLVLDTSCKWTHSTCGLSVWLLSYSIMFFKYIHVACKVTSFFFIPLYGETMIFLYPFISDGHLSCFQFWAIMNNAAEHS